eukprot:366588_1
MSEHSKLLNGDDSNRVSNGRNAKLTDEPAVREYFENECPTREAFCDTMKQLYNSPYSKSLKAWQYLLDEKESENKELQKEKQKYQHILQQLLPHLQSLINKQSVHKIDECQYNESQPACVDIGIKQCQTSRAINEDG